MKRIQGWGNIETDYPVPEPAKQYLAGAVGQPLKLQKRHHRITRSKSSRFQIARPSPDHHRRRRALAPLARPIPQ